MTDKSDRSFSWDVDLRFDGWKAGSNRRMKIGVSILAAVLLLCDVVYTITHLFSGESFAHIPFLYPIVLAFIVGMLEWMDRNPHHRFGNVHDSKSAPGLQPVELTHRDDDSHT